MSIQTCKQLIAPLVSELRDVKLSSCKRGIQHNAHTIQGR